MMANKLSAYLAKRDFASTPEPQRGAAASALERLRFVVQKHDATRLRPDSLRDIGTFSSLGAVRIYLSHLGVQSTCIG